MNRRNVPPKRGPSGSHPGTLPLDLRQFASRYRLDYDDALAAERPEFRQDEAVALQTIPCRFGHLFPWGLSRLAASTDRAGPVARALKALMGVRIEQDGDDGATVSFPPELLPAVAAVMRPKRRAGRHALSSGERKRLAEAGRSYRFARGKPPTQRHLEIVRPPNATPESSVEL